MVAPARAPFDVVERDPGGDEVLCELPRPPRARQRVGPSGEPLGEPVEVPVTAPGEQKSAAVEVEAGQYRMWCNLYNHAKEGMEATITVE